MFLEYRSRPIESSFRIPIRTRSTLSHTSTNLSRSNSIYGYSKYISPPIQFDYHDDISHRHRAVDLVHILLIDTERKETTVLARVCVCVCVNVE